MAPKNQNYHLIFGVALTQNILLHIYFISTQFYNKEMSKMKIKKKLNQYF